MRCLLIAAAVLWPACAALAGDGPLKTHTEMIRSGRHEFQIVVDGTEDPENVTITIENAGGAAVKNPRITVNGLYDWYTLPGMVAGITRTARTEEEIARALFSFVREKSYWWTFPKDLTANNPVRHFNAYGYHICSMAASVYVGLCRAAGLEARVWEINHHTVAEVKWDGAWHHMDPDLGVWYLKSDNRTVASMAELQQHPEWVSRSYIPPHFYVGLDGRRRLYSPAVEPGGLIYSPGADPAGVELAGFYASAEDNYVARGYDALISAPADMNFTLRPEEKLVRWWKPVLRKYYDQGATHEPPRYANGRIIFAPDFDKRTYTGMIARENVKFRSEDGAGPAAHVDVPRDPVHDKAAFLTVPMESPYPVVGGYIDTAYYKGGTGKLDRVSLALDADPVLGERKLLWDYYNWAWGLGEARAELDSKVVRSGPKATYRIQAVYTLSADRRSEAPAGDPLVYGGRTGVDRVRIVLDLQVNPDSLPALSRGRNIIRYTDETAEPHEVKVTYEWRERSGGRPPDAPVLLSPADGAAGQPPAPALTWDGGPLRYRVQVSLRPDCAWPVATALDREVRRGTAFQVPAGWLNDGTTYYWRVRAEDGQGRLGPWSAPRRFTTR